MPTEIAIIPRSAWGAREPRSTKAIPTPTPELYLHHSAGSHKGPAGMRAMQDFHMDGRRWDDIAYSLVVDPIDLAVYEGRGIAVRGGHTFGRNSRSHGVCVMGNFETERPTLRLIVFLAALARHGYEQGWWAPPVYAGHRDVRPTACPGSLYDAIPEINHRASQGAPAMPILENELVGEIQQVLVDAEIDIGAGGLNNDGVDGKLGRRTVDGVHALKNQRNELRGVTDRALAEVAAAGGEIDRLQLDLQEARNEAATAMRELEELKAGIANGPGVDPRVADKAAKWDRFVAAQRELLVATGLAG